MPIPHLTAGGELPPGIHSATLQEVEGVFGSNNNQRRSLMKGLKEAIALLKAGNVSKVFIDGSFVSDKDEPNDVDGCWSSIDVVASKLDPRFWDFADEVDFQNKRASLKQEFGIDFYIAEILEGGSGKPFPAFFQTNRDGEAKGIIEVNL
jgi:hypothetical protein